MDALAPPNAGSGRLSGVADRYAGVGLLLPWSAMNFLIDTFCQPRCLAIRLTGTPASRMSQIVFWSSSENRFHIPTPPGL